jgi:anti-sigma regulatory factor (Ser/Thr protein kinase)
MSELRHKTFARRFDALASVFAFVRESLDALGVDAAHELDVDLIVEELFTNMVKYNHDGKHDIEIEIATDREQLTIRLIDRDVAPFDMTRVPDPDLQQPLAERRPGGLGLYLVKQLTESLAYEHAAGASRVTAVRSLHRQNESPRGRKP